MLLKQAWEAFEKSGKVADYLNFKALEQETSWQHDVGERELLGYANYDRRDYHPGQNPQQR